MADSLVLRALLRHVMAVRLAATSSRRLPRARRMARSVLARKGLSQAQRVSQLLLDLDEESWQALNRALPGHAPLRRIGEAAP